MKPELDLFGSVETIRARPEQVGDAHRGPGLARDDGFQDFQEVDRVSRTAGGCREAALHQAVGDAVP